VTTITYSQDEEGEWVANDPAVTTRPLTNNEKAKLGPNCIKENSITYSDWKGDPKCDVSTVLETRTKSTISYTYNAETGLFVPATPAVTDESRTRDLAAAEKKPCPTATPPAQFQVASNSPVVPPAAAAPAAPAAAVSAVPTQLPATGNSSWVTALLALVTLLGGTALVRVGRRPTD
jgi:LPXTG-motif cell wall-anchored protein